MSEPEPLSVDDALDRLVNQFADAMAFFRELIQNAIDAGSEEVDVEFEHDDGMMIVRVIDSGAGMNREIIETRLTRLFSSSKDGDRTKIGKFGIGFVSVFAINPDAVSIDTSRDGEHWRIVFDDKRRFSLIRREEPIEGTTIEIYKRATRAEFEQFRARAREVVRYWCKHVGAEIRCEGEVINEAFDLDAPLEVRHTHEEELLVVAHPRDGQAFAGFYNRGLTLVELTSSTAEAQREGLIAGIAFKASSAKLEHTLTRDDVIREAGFHSLMSRVHAAIAGELCEQVFAALDRSLRELVAIEADARDEQREWLEYLWTAALLHERRKHAPRESYSQAVALSPSGRLHDAVTLRRGANRRVIIARMASPLAELLEQRGELVVWLPAKWVHGRAFIDALAPSTADIEDWCTALPPRDSGEATRWQVLASSVATLLDDWGAKLGGVRLGHLEYPHSSVAERVAITQSEYGEATPVAEASTLGTSLFSSRRVVVLNADHPTIRSVAALAQTEPELAAYLAVKAFFLGDRLDAATDEKLMTASFDRRLLRTGTRTGRSA